MGLMMLMMRYNLLFVKHIFVFILMMYINLNFTYAQSQTIESLDALMKQRNNLNQEKLLQDQACYNNFLINYCLSKIKKEWYAKMDILEQRIIDVKKQKRLQLFQTQPAIIQGQKKYVYPINESIFDKDFIVNANNGFSDKNTIKNIDKIIDSDLLGVSQNKYILKNNNNKVTDINTKDIAKDFTKNIHNDIKKINNWNAFNSSAASNTNIYIMPNKKIENQQKRIDSLSKRRADLEEFIRKNK